MSKTHSLEEAAGRLTDGFYECRWKNFEFKKKLKKNNNYDIIKLLIQMAENKSVTIKRRKSL